ncbi:hypothetical protein [Megalodesulfovibrio paquesii]
MNCLYRKDFCSVDELDAFVMCFKLIRGIEFRWNRLERTAWLWCDRRLYEELQHHCPAAPYPPCEAMPV